VVRVTENGTYGTHRSPPTDRGQLVLVAAVALAAALVVLGFAYLQLGYSDDIAAGTVEPAHGIETTLDRSVHNASTDVPAAYGWDERTTGAATVRERLNATIETLNVARLQDGHVYDVSYNRTHAIRWGADNCPAGPNRQFDACDAVDGVVVQDRNGRTHVLGVAVDIRITTPETETTVTTVVERRAE